MVVRRSNNVAGATTTTLTVPNVLAGQNGTKFRAVFTNGAGTATTTAATLTVNFAPSVTTNPSDQTVSAGRRATFTAAASGNPTPTVQWQVSTDGGATFSNIAGATSTTLSFAATGRPERQSVPGGVHQHGGLGDDDGGDADGDGGSGDHHQPGG